MSEPSADADDVEPVPAQEKDLDLQLQPQGQAVGEADGAPPPDDDSTGSSPTSSGSSDDTIAEELARLESDAATARAEKAEADAALADLENRLATLRVVEKDAGTTTTTYTTAHERLDREAQAYQEYLQFQEEGLRHLLGEDGVSEVEALVRARSDRTEELDAATADAAATLHDAEAALDRLKVEVKERADALTGWKKLTATVTAQHADLTGLREEITKARQAGEYALAYWLLGRARARRESLTSGPRLVEPGDLEDELLDAVEALADTQKELADAERAATAAKADLTAATKARDKHRAESEAQLRENLRTAGSHATTGESNA